MASWLCRLGIHEWSDYRYLSPRECVQKQLCRRCNRIQTGQSVTTHSWEWQYRESHSCTQAQVCRRCGEKYPNRTRVEHAWKWKSLSQDSCEQMLVCVRCGEKQESKTQVAHDLEWEYQSTDACTQIQVCLRCGEKWKTSTRTVHLLGQNSCKCRRCGGSQHSMEQWKSKDPRCIGAPASIAAIPRPRHTPCQDGNLGRIRCT